MPGWRPWCAATAAAGLQSPAASRRDLGFRVHAHLTCRHTVEQPAAQNLLFATPRPKQQHGQAESTCSHCRLPVVCLSPAFAVSDGQWTLFNFTVCNCVLVSEVRFWRHVALYHDLRVPRLLERPDQTDWGSSNSGADGPAVYGAVATAPGPCHQPRCLDCCRRRYNHQAGTPAPVTPGSGWQCACAAFLSVRKK